MNTSWWDTLLQRRIARATQDVRLDHTTLRPTRALGDPETRQNMENKLYWAKIRLDNIVDSARGIAYIYHNEVE